MDKETIKAFKKAWALQNHIQDEVFQLAHMNVSLAYGCIRTAETMIDLILVRKLGPPPVATEKKGP